MIGSSSSSGQANFSSFASTRSVTPISNTTITTTKATTTVTNRAVVGGAAAAIGLWLGIAAAVVLAMSLLSLMIYIRHRRAKIRNTPAELARVQSDRIETSPTAEGNHSYEVPNAVSSVVASDLGLYEEPVPVDDVYEEPSKEAQEAYLARRKRNGANPESEYVTPDQSQVKKVAWASKKVPIGDGYSNDPINYLDGASQGIKGDPIYTEADTDPSPQGSPASAKAMSRLSRVSKPPSPTDSAIKRSDSEGSKSANSGEDPSAQNSADTTQDLKQPVYDMAQPEIGTKKPVSSLKQPIYDIAQPGVPAKKGVGLFGPRPRSSSPYGFDETTTDELKPITAADDPVYAIGDTGQEYAALADLGLRLKSQAVYDFADDPANDSGYLQCSP